MALAAVAVDFDEALDVLAHLAAEVALDGVVLVDEVADAEEFFVGEVARRRPGIHAGGLKELARAGGADAIDVAQRDFDALLVGDVDAGNPRHD